MCVWSRNGGIVGELGNWFLFFGFSFFLLKPAGFDSI